MTLSLALPPNAYEASQPLNPMSEAEARSAVSKITRDYESAISVVRRQLLEFDEREGWRALGYGSMIECAQAEFTRLGRSETYNELTAARVERELSNALDGPLPVRQALALARVEDGRKAEVLQAARATGEPVTAKTIERAATELGLGPNRWGERTSASNFRDYAGAMLKMSSEQLALCLMRLVRDGSVPMRCLFKAVDEQREADAEGRRAMLRELGGWLGEQAR